MGIEVEGAAERSILQRRPARVHWKSFEQAKIIDNGVNPNDIHQGGIGDCYLLAAISSVAVFPGYVEKMLCHGQRNDSGQYCVRWYCNNGKGQRDTWVTPSFVVNDGNDSFFHAHSENANEIWVNIIEKAYAQEYGGYDKIGNGGNIAKALADITGADVETTKVKYYTNQMNWQRITNGCENASKVSSSGRGHIMCAGITWSPFVRYATFGVDRLFMRFVYPCLTMIGLTAYVWPCWLFIIYGLYMVYSFIDAKLTCGTLNAFVNTLPSQYIVGLVSGHAYSVIGFKSHKVCGIFELKLVKVRNPWGNGVEWKGRWGDRSWMWLLFPALKAEINAAPAEDGSFWMGYNDFLMYFDTVDTCSVDIQSA